MLRTSVDVRLAERNRNKLSAVTWLHSTGGIEATLITAFRQDCVSGIINLGRFRMSLMCDVPKQMSR